MAKKKEKRGNPDFIEEILKEQISRYKDGKRGQFVPGAKKLVRSRIGQGKPTVRTGKTKQFSESEILLENLNRSSGGLEGLLFSFISQNMSITIQFGNRKKDKIKIETLDQLQGITKIIAETLIENLPVYIKILPKEKICGLG